ncbi:MAG: WD40 repeat domain-containing protein [Nostoc sp.]
MNIDSGETRTIIKQELPRGKRNDFGKASFSPDSQTITVGKEDGTIKLLHPDGTEIKTLTGGGKIVIYSPNGKIIASTGRDSTVKMWALRLFLWKIWFKIIESLIL